jgi:polysaccharide export outer membrane protein
MLALLSGVQRTMKPRFSCFSLLLLLFSLIGAPVVRAQSGAAEALQQTTVTGTNEAYRLAPGDAITVRFFYNPELNEGTQIRPDGRISLALIGEIEVSDLTIADVTSRLETLYKEILRRPAVTIQVTNYANRKFFVGGEVLKPGMFSLTGQQTVLGAILEAGGMTKSAKKNELYLIRRAGPEQAETLKISLQESPQQPSQAAMFRIEPYDVVIVTESWVSRANRTVDQYVRQMLPVLLTAGFTYLGGSTGAFEP